MSDARVNPYPSAALRRGGRARAFTLMEMVTSCAVLSLIMLSLGYGLKLALLSTGDGAKQTVGSLEAADAVERITDDMTEAIAFDEKTSEAVTFTVPDRGKDGKADKVRYKWWPAGGTATVSGTSSSSGSGSGTSGGGGLLGGLLGLLGGGGGGGSSGSSGGSTSSDATIVVPAFTLTREYGDGLSSAMTPPSVMARDVRQFSLNYLHRTLSPVATTPATGGILLSHDPIVGIPRDYTLDASRWMGETFLPSASLPAGTTSFSITRVGLLLKGDATFDGLLRVSVRTVSTDPTKPNWPTNTMLESVLVSEVSLSDAYQWVEVPFTTLNNLSPGTKYAIVVQGVPGPTGSPFGTVSWMQAGTPIASSTWMVTTTTTGSSWSATLTNSLRYRIYCTTTP